MKSNFSPREIVSELDKFIIGQKKAKEVVLQYLLDNEPLFMIEYTSHGNPKPESYDRADAIIIAKAGYKIQHESL